MFRQLRTASLVGSLLMTGTAFASGYEKAIMFGGRSAGVAGIASPYIQGPSALYFNPAGLVSDKEGHAAEVDISGLYTQFKGPIDNSNAQLESEKKFLTPFGLFYGQTINEKFGYGVGAYVSAGSQAKYTDIKIGNSTGNTVETDLTVVEFAGGAAYKVMPKLKVGLAYRVLMTDGQFSFIKRVAGTAFVNAKITDLKGMTYSGFKLGAQYDLSEDTKIGFNYRSQVDISAKGKIGGSLYNGSTTTTLSENDATVKTALPQAVTLGAEHKFGASWNGYAEYVWTQYSRIDHVTVDGALATSSNADDLDQKWHDQHQVKLAGEYLGFGLPIRFGYIWTSQVTNDDYARASFTAPGAAHTLTLGSGYNFGEKFALNGALDYTTVKGTGNGAAAGSTTGDIRQGEHETTAYALHLGLSYNF